MFKFQYTEYLLSLAAVPLLALLFLLVIRWKKKISARMGDSLLVKELTKQHSPGKFILKFVLLAIAFISCAFALSNPRKPGSTEKVTRNGIDLMIALDVSKSMLAQDVKPTRLDRAKQLLSKLVDRLENDRIGIVVFAGKAYIQMPLTGDHSAAKMYIGSCSPDIVQTQGTVISDALERCFESFSTREKKYKAVLLLSDGEDHDEGASAMASKMADEGVMINTVGIGSPDGAPIMDPATNEYKKDRDGNTVVSKLNEEELRSLAEKGRGIYQLYTNSDDVVAKLEAQLETMGQRTVTEDSLVNYESFFSWFLAAGLLFLVVETFIGERKRMQKKAPMPVKKPATILGTALLFSTGLFAQTNNEIIKKGNESYSKKEYKTATDQYKKVIEKDPSNSTAQFNLGNALYKNSSPDEAMKSYDKAIESAKESNQKAAAYYNKGVALQNQKKLPECIAAYKQALRIDPADEDARLNLQKALVQQKQEQKKKDDQKKKDPKDDQKKKEQPKKDEKKKEEQQPKPQPSKLSKQEAEEKLKALMQDEKKLQEKLRKVPGGSSSQPDKDW